MGGCGVKRRKPYPYVHEIVDRHGYHRAYLPPQAGMPKRAVAVTYRLQGLYRNLSNSIGTSGQSRGSQEGRKYRRSGASVPSMASRAPTRALRTGSMTFGREPGCLRAYRRMGSEKPFVELLLRQGSHPTRSWRSAAIRR